VKYEFRWNDWNIEQIDRHGIGREEAEYVVSHAKAPYPRYEGDGKFVVRGQSFSGTYMQVVYIFSPADVVYVIHARELTDSEKRRFRRRK